MQRFERPKLCRLCEFPVVDGGVRVSREQLDQVSRWMERKFGSGLRISEDEEQKTAGCWLICQFCSWDARFYSDNSEESVENSSEFAWWPQGPDEVFEKYYKEDFLKPCFVDVGVIPRVRTSEEESSPGTDLSNSNDTLKFHLETAEKLGKGNDEWFCVYCNKSFQEKRDQMSIHMKRYHKNLALRCAYYNCSTFFKTEKDRTEHEQKVHENRKGTSQCIYCKIWCSSLLRHVTTYHKNEIIRCSYKLCRTFFRTEEDKEDHIKKIHKAEKIRKIFTCLYCEQVRRAYQALVKHTNLKHNKLLFKCNVYCCGLYFKTDMELQTHFEEKHPLKINAKIFNCNHCKYKSIWKQRLRLHLINMHGPQNLECSLCEKKFGSMNLLKDHKKRHEKKSCPHCQLKFSPMVYRHHVQSDFCKYCKEKFPCSGLLKKHKIQCKPSNECSICSIHFKKHCELKYHMKLKHSKQELVWKNIKYQSRDFKCTKCRKYFSSNNSLKAHQKTMHGDRIFLTCDLCKKQVTSKPSMERHLGLVHKIREHILNCSACSKTFFREFELRQHWNHVHAEKNHVECDKCGNIMPKSRLAGHNQLLH